MISTKQHLNDNWFPLNPRNEAEFFKSIGLWEPLIVSTETEYDYLYSMQLMLGRTFIVLLDGRDEPIPNMPPTYVKIDLPLQ